MLEFHMDNEMWHSVETWWQNSPQILWKLCIYISKILATSNINMNGRWVLIVMKRNFFCFHFLCITIFCSILLLLIYIIFLRIFVLLFKRTTGLVFILISEYTIRLIGKKCVFCHCRMNSFINVNYVRIIKIFKYSIHLPIFHTTYQLQIKECGNLQISLLIYQLLILFHTWSSLISCIHI